VSGVRLGCHRHADERDHEQDEETGKWVAKAIASVAGIRNKNTPHASDFLSTRSRSVRGARCGGGSL